MTDEEATTEKLYIELWDVLDGKDEALTMSALTAIIVDLSMHYGMPKRGLLTVISTVWDLTEQDNAARERH